MQVEPCVNRDVTARHALAQAAIKLCERRRSLWFCRVVLGGAIRSRGWTRLVSSVCLVAN
jgi:hypothetical protein